MEDEKNTESFKEFRNKIIGSRKDEKAKVRNSIGSYDIYKKIRKQNWLDIGRPLKEHEFYSIIRRVNNLLAAEVGKGNSITFPSRMGSLELRKLKRGVYINKNGKLRVCYPIDWNATLKLWFEDPEAKKEKILVRMESNYVFKVAYNKHNATYENKSFYEFDVNRKIKQALKDNIKAGKVDTLYEEKQY